MFDATIPSARPTATSTQIPEPQQAHLPDSSLDRNLSYAYPPPPQGPNAFLPGGPTEGVPPRFGQFTEHITTQPPPPYSAMSTRQQEAPNEQADHRQTLTDTYLDDYDDSSNRRCCKDCMLYGDACTCLIETCLAITACIFCCCS